MRILSFVSVSFLAVSSLVHCEAQDASKKTDRASATAIYGTPKIDGDIDDAWKSAVAVDVKKIVRSETSMADADVATATVKLMWDKEYLYALWQVKDSRLSVKADNDYEEDSIEFFVDELNERAGSYQKDDAQYRVSCEGKISGAGEGYKEGNIKAVAKKIEGGYLVEMSVKISFAKPAGGTQMGLELQINDNTGSGSRGGVTKFNHPENDSYQSTSDFGVLILKEKN